MNGLAALVAVTNEVGLGAVTFAHDNVTEVDPAVSVNILWGPIITFFAPASNN